MPKENSELCPTLFICVWFYWFNCNHCQIYDIDEVKTFLKIIKISGNCLDALCKHGKQTLCVDMRCIWFVIQSIKLKDFCHKKGYFYEDLFWRHSCLPDFSIYISVIFKVIDFCFPFQHFWNNLVLVLIGRYLSGSYQLSEN